MIKSIFIIIIFYLLIGCVSKNYTKTDKKILDYKSAGSSMNALSAGSPGAAVLFLAVGFGSNNTNWAHIWNVPKLYGPREAGMDKG